MTAATETELPNLKKIVSRFSLEEIPKVVIETDSNYFSAYYGAYCLMPAMNNHQITESLIANGYRPWLPYSSAIKAVGKDESTVITPLLVTSEKAFLKSYDATILEKEAGDEEGMFAVGVVSELKPAENGEKPTLVWYASPYAMDLVEANITLATNTLDYLMGDEEGLSIPTRTITNSILILS